VFNLESRLKDISILEILPRQYTGLPFPGYSKTSLSWAELCSIVTNDRRDWKTALSNIRGIYLITLINGQQYIGSAYGDTGIWAR